ncbi:hypothetical protein FACS1894199_05820 [Bacteroidia bacterium]|nr:hypothetical protein FACS1894199_05820 [Bacteroidia bacterium]
MQKKMYDLKKLCPLHLEDLTRVGRDADGGYVLSNRQIEKTKILLSFGINTDWTFEESFVERCHHKPVRLYAFDASVSLPKFKALKQQYFVNTIVHFLLGNIPQAKKNRNRWNSYRQAVKDFTRFFQPSLHHFFIPKFVGREDDGTYTRLDTVLTSLYEVEDLSVFIKMDIESWEYRTLPQLEPFFDKINGVVVEFHELDIVAERFEEMIDLFSTHFDIAHVHANNTGGVYTTQPVLLEVTFINKVLTGGAPFSSRTYPIEGLDFPNKPEKSDIQLVF